jgi:hypothetical protein|tara:strand:+ start:245 stop:460 length:216 start_codon:yes stop_codon:yes gene_type:complete
MRFEHFVIQGGLEKAIVEINKGVQYTLDDKFEDARACLEEGIWLLKNAETLTERLAGASGVPGKKEEGGVQ